MILDFLLQGLTVPDSLSSLPFIKSASANFITSDTLFVPFYGTSANGFTTPARGWNTFGLQTLGHGYVLNQTNVRAQCDLMNATAGYTICSIDSGWSANGGDQFGRLVPDPSTFSDMAGLASHLHSQGKKLGIYILPGALSADANAIVQGTNIRLGSLFDTSTTQLQLATDI